MSALVDEFFGEPAQQALQRRSDHLWTLVKNDPRFCCHGRAVGLAEATEQNIGDQIALAKLQGARSMLAMRDRFGYEHFFAGIREGNTPSERLCAKLGLIASEKVVMIAIAPELFASGRVTK